METHTLVEDTPEQQLTLPPKQAQPTENNHRTLPDSKQMRVEHVGALLAEAYKGASQLKLKADERKKLREDFPDDVIEIRPHDGFIFLNHVALRERLYDVLGIGDVAEICRERFMKGETNEVAVDLVLLVRGCFVAEAVGAAKYYPQNPKTSFKDVIESAWSDALRLCCKHWGVGLQTWRPGYQREWVAKYAVQQGGKWLRRDDPRALTPEPTRKAREYTMTAPASEFQKIKAAVQAAPEVDEDGDPIPF
jgi:hypothetical protein